MSKETSSKDVNLLRKLLAFFHPPRLVSCYCIYVLWCGLATICSFRPQGSKCIPGAKSLSLRIAQIIATESFKLSSYHTELSSPPAYSTNNDKGEGISAVPSLSTFCIQIPAPPIDMHSYPTCTCYTLSSSHEHRHV